MARSGWVGTGRPGRQGLAVYVVAGSGGVVGQERHGRHGEGCPVGKAGPGAAGLA